jgi:pyrroloquinoline quinone (PQQ) biosynthesis protein C
MQAEQTFVKLEYELEEYDLLRHPFYEAWSAGELRRIDLLEYAAEYYHHVAAFPTYLSALHSKLPDGRLRRVVVQNLFAEELDGAAHSDLWLDCAEGMGADRELVKARVPVKQVQADRNVPYPNAVQRRRACGLLRLRVTGTAHRQRKSTEPGRTLRCG